MARTLYLPPVSRLIALGNPALRDHWPDYRAFGIDERSIDELIRMAVDDDLHHRQSDDPAVFAPVHAWMALGVLRAERAVEPLLSLLHRIDDEQDDWAGEQLPHIFGMIGPAGIAPLEAYLLGHGHGEYARVAAAQALREIAFVWPDARLQCAAALQAALEGHHVNPAGLNGFLVSYLVDVAPADSIPLLEEVFRHGRVDTMVCGDLDAVRAEVRRRFTPHEPAPLLRHRDVAGLDAAAPDAHAGWNASIEQKRAAKTDRELSGTGQLRKKLPRSAKQGRRPKT